MVYLDKTFYDKRCDIYRISVVDKDWTQVPQRKLIYKDVSCDYYIAPRWNVINYLPNIEARNTERDRFDCVIPWKLFTKPILKWDSVVLYTTEWDLEWTYTIDQLSILRLPSWKVENVYLRLNNDSKWNLH